MYLNDPILRFIYNQCTRCIHHILDTRSFSRHIDIYLVCRTMTLLLILSLICFFRLSRFFLHLSNIFFSVFFRIGFFSGAGRYISIDEPIHWRNQKERRMTTVCCLAATTWNAFQLNVSLNFTYSHSNTQTVVLTGYASDHNNEIKYLYDGKCDVINSKRNCQTLLLFYIHIYIYLVSFIFVIQN